MKTIRMPKELLAKWLAALRSGEYAQGDTFLVDSEGRYCCLGVLQHVADGDVERHSHGPALCMPSMEWRKEKGVEFFHDNGSVSGCSPHLPKLGTSAVDANDARGYSFPEIADAIESCAEGY